MKRRKILSIFRISLLLILTLLFPIWERYPGGFWVAFLVLSIAILFIWVFISIVLEIVSLIRNRNKKSISGFTPLIIQIFGLVIVFFFPLNIEEEFYGEINFRAYYEGTQNQATFFLREPNMFEIHHTGVFFYDKFFRGSYTMTGDTINLNYFGDVYDYYGDKVFIDRIDNKLKPIKGDSLINSRSNFYF